VLTGKYQAGSRPASGTRLGDMPNLQRRFGDAEFTAVERLKSWAQQRGHTTAETAVAALLSYPEVSTVIIGARTREQVLQNARLGDWQMTPEERDEAIGILNGKTERPS
jgi:aryl-alcohol dehydrogenase-like predicted oxidoreductase